uniref:acyltransferase family protein n=1 Tax=Ferrovum sp. TaxID=2609467 RepID=UPI00262D3A8A
EVCLYFCIPLIFYLFKRLGTYRAALLIFLLSVFWAWIFGNILGGKVFEEVARQFPGQLSYFVMGSLIFIVRPESKHLGRLVALSFLLFVVFRHHTLRLLIEPIFYASLVIFLTTRSTQLINAGKWGDLSYGTYLLHFPIIQLFIHLGLYRMKPWLSLTATLATVLAAALVSWHLIERPMLKRSSHYILATKNL